MCSPLAGIVCGILRGGPTACMAIIGVLLLAGCIQGVSAAIDSSYSCTSAGSDVDLCGRMLYHGCHWDSGTSTCQHYASCSAVPAGICSTVNGCRVHINAVTCSDQVVWNSHFYTTCNSFNGETSTLFERAQACYFQSVCEWDDTNFRCIPDRNVLATAVGVTQAICEQDGTALWLTSDNPNRCSPNFRTITPFNIKYGLPDGTCDQRVIAQDCTNAFVQGDCKWNTALQRCLATPPVYGQPYTNYWLNFCGECDQYSTHWHDPLWSSSAIGPSDCFTSSTSCAAKFGFCVMDNTVTPDPACVFDQEAYCPSFYNETLCNAAGTGLGRVPDAQCAWCADQSVCMSYTDSCTPPSNGGSTGTGLTGDHVVSTDNNLAITFANVFVDENLLMTLNAYVPVRWVANDPWSSSFFLGTSYGIFGVNASCTSETATPPTPTTLPVTQDFRDFFASRILAYDDFNLTSNNPAFQQDTYHPLNPQGIVESIAYQDTGFVQQTTGQAYLIYTLSVDILRATKDVSAGGCSQIGNGISVDTSEQSADLGGLISYTIPINYMATQKNGFNTLVSTTARIVVSSTGAITAAVSESTDYDFSADLERIEVDSSSCPGGQERLYISMGAEYTSLNPAFSWSAAAFDLDPNAGPHFHNHSYSFGPNCYGLVWTDTSTSCVGSTCLSSVRFKTQCRTQFPGTWERCLLLGQDALVNKFPLFVVPWRCPAGGSCPSDPSSNGGTGYLYKDAINAVIDFRSASAVDNNGVLTFDVISGILNAETDPLSALQLQGHTLQTDPLLAPFPVIVAGTEVFVVAIMSHAVLRAGYNLVIEPDRSNITVQDGAHAGAVFALNNLQVSTVLDRYPKRVQTLTALANRVAACVGVPGCDGFAISSANLVGLEGDATRFLFRLRVTYAPISISSGLPTQSVDGDGPGPASRSLMALKELTTEGFSTQTTSSTNNSGGTTIVVTTTIVNVLIDMTSIKEAFRSRHSSDWTTGTSWAVGISVFFLALLMCFLCLWARDPDNRDFYYNNSGKPMAPVYAASAPPAYPGFNK